MNLEEKILSSECIIVFVESTGKSGNVMTPFVISENRFMSYDVSYVCEVRKSGDFTPGERKSLLLRMEKMNMSEVSRTITVDWITKNPVIMYISQEG